MDNISQEFVSDSRTSLLDSIVRFFFFLIIYTYLYVCVCICIIILSGFHFIANFVSLFIHIDTYKHYNTYMHHKSPTSTGVKTEKMCPMNTLCVYGPKIRNGFIIVISLLLTLIFTGIPNNTLAFPSKFGNTRSVLLFLNNGNKSFINISSFFKMMVQAC